MSELLTGKCKEDFEKWFEINYPYKRYDLQIELYLNALIIEFFDSVGIYISVKCSFCSCNIWKYLVHEINFEDIELNILNFDSRQQATNEAIKKANLIYNGL